MKTISQWINGRHYEGSPVGRLPIENPGTGEIEAELGVTRATCRSHITALLARLGARDRAQLVIVAYEAGLISPR